MSCQALALQPVNGNDILLQSREWFPPARAAKASLTFRLARAVLSGRSQSSESLEAYGVGIGDDALTASSGQVVLGKEDKYRVVYRLVSGVYVLGITTADASNNVFECAGTVNQAVTVLVAACKGIDVTADKLNRKYTEVYMALDMVLHGVSGARLQTILATMHGEGVSQAVVTATDLENRARGAGQWSQFKQHSVQRIAHLEVFSGVVFELPEETLAAGDEVAAAFGPPAQTVGDAAAAAPQKPVEQKKPVSEDPFEASTALTNPDEIAGSFQKSKEGSADPTAALAGLEVTATIAPETAAESTYVGVEGFEGEYGGVDFEADNDGFGGLGGAFEGLGGAFGGGLDISEFDGVVNKLDKGLAGLEELQGGGGKKSDAPADPFARVSGAPATVAASDAGGVEKKPASVAPPEESTVLSLVEEFFATYEGLALPKIGLQGTLQLKTSSRSAQGKGDVEFSFRLDGAAGIQRTTLQDEFASSLGEGLYHVRVPAANNPVIIMKYRLEPRFTPLPIRIRLLTSKDNTSLTFMIQYIANPYLPGILKDVVFVTSLPSSPTFVKMSPHGYLSRKEKQVKWIVPEIKAGSQGRLRAQLPKKLVADTAGRHPVDLSGDTSSVQEEEQADTPKMMVRVEFSCVGQTLSGIVVNPVGQVPDLQVKHSYKVAKLHIHE